MENYLVLLRGINVGGKNKVPMLALKACLQDAGFARVTTYIASGNVMLASDKQPAVIQAAVEATLAETFTAGGPPINVLVLPHRQLQAIVANRPAGFGGQPSIYHSDVIFLMGIAAADTLPVFSPREGVDAIWAGDGVVYSQRLSAERTKSRLSKIMASPLYKSMTIRTWNTTATLLKMMDAMPSA